MSFYVLDISAQLWGCGKPLRWRKREDDTVGCGGGHCISAVADAIKSKRKAIATIFEVVFGDIQVMLAEVLQGWCRTITH